MATLKIDDNEYEIDDLPESVKAKVARMQEIQAQIKLTNYKQSFRLT